MNDDEICEMSDLPRSWCAHCKGMTEEDPAEGFEVVGRTFEAMYPGRCTIDEDHVVKRGSTVARVRLASNPMLPQPGVACASCVKILPRARG